MSDIVFVNDTNFETEVLKSDVPVLASFGASWCAPCKKQLPLLEKYAADNLDKIKVCKIDVDDAPLLSSKFGIKSVPTLHLFSAGKSLASKVGLISLAEMNNFVSLSKTG